MLMETRSASLRKLFMRIPQYTGGTAGAIFNVLDYESRDPVLVKNRSKNSFYGHPFPSAVSFRAATSFLRKSGHSILINYLGGYLEQCRSLNPLIGTGSSIRLN